MYVHIHQVLKLTCTWLDPQHCPHSDTCAHAYYIPAYTSFHQIVAPNCSLWLIMPKNPILKPSAIMKNCILSKAPPTLWAYHQQIQVKKSRTNLSWDHYKVILQAKTHPQKEFSYPGFHRHWLKPISVSAQFLSTFPHSISAPRRSKSTTSDECEHELCSFCVQNNGLNVLAVFRCMHCVEFTKATHLAKVDHVCRPHILLCIMYCQPCLQTYSLTSIYSPVVIKTCTVFTITVRSMQKLLLSMCTNECEWT